MPLVSTLCLWKCVSFYYLHQFCVKWLFSKTHCFGDIREKEKEAIVISCRVTNLNFFPKFMKTRRKTQELLWQNHHLTGLKVIKSVQWDPVDVIYDLLIRLSHWLTTVTPVTAEPDCVTNLAAGRTFSDRNVARIHMLISTVAGFISRRTTQIVSHLAW